MLFVPKLGVNLLSLSLITSRNYSLSFNKDSCYIKTPNYSLLAKGNYKEGISIFSTISPKPINTTVNNTNAILNTSNLEEVEENITIEKAINLEEENNYSTSTSKEEEIVFNKNTIELVYNRLGYISLKAIKYLKENTIEVDYINLENIGTASTSLDNYITCI